MKRTSTHGFTLIELLVVIAIIGILSAVVLAALNTGRSKGSDATVKSALSSARAQAELYFDSANGSFATVCNVGAIANGNKGINDIVLSAGKASGAGITTVSINAYLTPATKAICNQTANGWLAQVPLKSDATKPYFCVDSTGYAGTLAASAPTSASDVTCQ